MTKRKDSDLPAAPGDENRGRGIPADQGRRVYEQAKREPGEFYCAKCANWFPNAALDLHAGH